MTGPDGAAGPDRPTREQEVVEQPSVSTAPPPGRPHRWWSSIPRHLGRARTSTVVLGVLFLAVFALYLNVRPDPTGATTTGDDTSVTTPAPTTEGGTPAPTTTTVPPSDTAPEPTTTTEVPTTSAPTTEETVPPQTTTEVPTTGTTSVPPLPTSATPSG